MGRQEEEWGGRHSRRNSSWDKTMTSQLDDVMCRPGVLVSMTNQKGAGTKSICHRWVQTARVCAHRRAVVICCTTVGSMICGWQSLHPANPPLSEVRTALELSQHNRGLLRSQTTTRSTVPAGSAEPSYHITGRQRTTLRRSRALITSLRYAPPFPRYSYSSALPQG